jgi:hypothetical protein
MMITAVTMLLPTALYSTFPVSEIDDRVLSFSRGNEATAEDLDVAVSRVISPPVELS